MTKLCTKCQTEKPDAEFPKDKRLRSGLNSQCRVCHAARSKQHYTANRTKRISTDRYRVKIRRDIGRDVRPNAEQLDGKVFEFTASWVIEDNEAYPGEMAMISRDPNYPKDAPPWIASGDMEKVVDDKATPTLDASRRYEG